MVRIGEHSLELVNATTKVPLPEYTHSDGETWVEGRPGDEYLLKLTAHQAVTRTLADPILVDGTCVGVGVLHGPCHANQPVTLGSIPTGGASNNIAGKIECPAFRFARLSTSSDQTETTRHGTVTVTWSDAEDTGQPTDIHHFQSSWNESQTVAADSKKDGVGALKSTFGSSSVEIPMATTRWLPTNRLYTITIRYCEQAGLVARKIIPAPQATTVDTSSNTLNNDNDQSRGPARKKKKTTNDGISAQRAAGSVVADVVDLTGHTTTTTTTTTTTEDQVDDRAKVKQESRPLA